MEAKLLNSLEEKSQYNFQTVMIFEDFCIKKLIAMQKMSYIYHSIFFLILKIGKWNSDGFLNHRKLAFRRDFLTSEIDEIPDKYT